MRAVWSILLPPSFCIATVHAARKTYGVVKRMERCERRCGAPRSSRGVHGARRELLRPSWKPFSRVVERLSFQRDPGTYTDGSSRQSLLSTRGDVLMRCACVCECRVQDTEDAVLGGSPDYVIDAIDNIDTKVPCPLGPHE